MELDRVLGFAVIFAWDDLKKVPGLSSALVYPPTADEIAEATNWFAGTHGVATNVSFVEDEEVAAR